MDYAISYRNGVEKKIFHSLSSFYSIIFCIYRIIFVIL